MAVPLSTQKAYFAVPFRYILEPEVDVDANTTVQHFMDRIETLTGIPVYNQQLVVRDPLDRSRFIHINSLPSQDKLFKYISVFDRVHPICVIPKSIIERAPRLEGKDKDQ